MPLRALLIIEEALYLFIRGSTSSPGRFSLASLFPLHLRDVLGCGAGQGMGFILSPKEGIYRNFV